MENLIMRQNKEILDKINSLNYYIDKLRRDVVAMGYDIDVADEIISKYAEENNLKLTSGGRLARNKAQLDNIEEMEERLEAFKSEMYSAKKFQDYVKENYEGLTKSQIKDEAFSIYLKQAFPSAYTDVKETYEEYEQDKGDIMTPEAIQYRVILDDLTSPRHPKYTQSDIAKLLITATQYKKYREAHKDLEGSGSWKLLRTFTGDDLADIF